MTQLLRRAFSRAAKLPEVEQNLFARWLMEELASERRWDKAFAESEQALTHLAMGALKEHRRGKTQELDPDRL